MIHFHLYLVGDLLHDALALGLRLIEETSSEMFHVTVAWEENTANHTLSFEVFYPEVVHINTTYIFLVKAGYVAMPNFEEDGEIHFWTICPEEGKLKISFPL